MLAVLQTLDCICPGKYHDFFHPFFATFLYIMGASVEKNDLVYYTRQTCNIVDYGRTTEVAVGGGGFQAGGGTGHNVSVMNHDENNAIRHKVKNGQYVTVEIYKDAKAVHDQMEFGVFFPKGTYLIFLEKKRISKGKMYVVLPNMTTEWRDGAAEPAERDKLDLHATSREAGDFLRDHV